MIMLAVGAGLGGWFVFMLWQTSTEQRRRVRRPTTIADVLARAAVGFRQIGEAMATMSKITAALMPGMSHAIRQAQHVERQRMIDAIVADAERRS